MKVLMTITKVKMTFGRPFILPWSFELMCGEAQTWMMSHSQFTKHEHIFQYECATSRQWHIVLLKHLLGGFVATFLSTWTCLHPKWGRTEGTVWVLIVSLGNLGFHPHSLCLYLSISFSLYIHIHISLPYIYIYTHTYLSITVQILHAIFFLLMCLTHKSH